jgi:UDP-N-acetylmuramate dehydrogenase
VKIERNVPLCDKNWFRTGGNAAYFCEPRTVDEFKEALAYAHEQKREPFILGLGANVLISDDGIDGLVIRPALREVEQIAKKDDYFLVKAGAGVTIHQLIEWCLTHNLIGLEEFSGIPGSVGGSVYNNLHYFEHSLSDFVISGEVIHKETGQIQEVDNEWFGFGYDQSRLHDHDYFLLSATFSLKKGMELDTAYARGRRAEIMRHRIKRYPISHTCGCFFRNFYDHEVGLEINGKKAVWVAYYLDKLGFKGSSRVGGAIVSSQHANMIVNTGNATSKDIIELAREMQRQVKEKFNLVPKVECQLLGFKQYPLLV